MPGKITVRNYTTLTDYADIATSWNVPCWKEGRGEKIMDSGLRLQRVKGMV
ncbi:MAG: hypothetical protein ACLVCH_04300 [Roseburia inulinivorans]